MHSSSVLNLERFFKIYLKKFDNPTILDYGGASHDNKTTALTVLEKHYTNYKYRPQYLLSNFNCLITSTKL